MKCGLCGHEGPVSEFKYIMTPEEGLVQRECPKCREVFEHGHVDDWEDKVGKAAEMSKEIQALLEAGDVAGANKKRYELIDSNEQLGGIPALEEFLESVSKRIVEERKKARRGKPIQY